MGSAIGLAIAGLRPIPEIQFEGFPGPAYDQLTNHAARYRTRGRAVTIPMTVRVPVGRRGSYFAGAALGLARGDLCTRR
ncbi:MAG: hypothetical protein R3B46_05095 [Phycisphaerales bacterium]